MTNKYRSVRCEGYHSKLEKAVGDQLWFREKAGEISDIRRQIGVRLGSRTWKCDFSYEEDGETVYCEAKGMITREWLWIKEMWKLVGPGRLEILGGHYTRPQTMEIIEKGLKWT